MVNQLGWGDNYAIWPILYPCTLNPNLLTYLLRQIMMTSWHGNYFRITSPLHVEDETNGRHFADAIFKCIVLNENVRIPIKISLKFVPKGPTNNIPVMVQIMAWRRSGDKPLSEPMMVSLPTHICVARPQRVNGGGGGGTPSQRPVMLRFGVSFVINSLNKLLNAQSIFR